MKKLWIAVLAIMMAGGAVAQQGNPMMEPIPADKAVRIGKLDNGMTYYLRHNEKPKGQADFYILHDVGAIQEEDDQQGLAHFLEHMAFNGTKNMEGKQMIKYLEKVGVNFGRNLNAGTSWDYTVYQMTDVPTSRQGIIDSALLVLHDWSHFITLAPEEIDNERGVICEELRTRDGASWRSTIAMLGAIGRGTRYEHRNLIGHLDGLKSFSHEALRNFYHRWYRPDYQAVIVVGDIDVYAVEAQIKTLMADIPAPSADAPRKEEIHVPDNEAPIISIFADPEMPQTSAMLLFKREAAPKQYRNTVAMVMQDLVLGFYDRMANERLHEIAMQPDAPFTSAYVGNGSVGIIPTLEGTIMEVSAREGELNKALTAAYVELERIRRYGFTQGEFERAREKMLSAAEKEYNNRNDRENNRFVNEYITHFRMNEAIPDAETQWQMTRTMLEQIPLAAINQVAAQLTLPNNNIVVVINVPEKEGLAKPTEEEIAAILTSTYNAGEEVVKPFEDNSVKEPLIADPDALKGRPVVKESANAAMGTTEWTLKNGARIVVKPTAFKADEIRFFATAKGGTALLEDDDEAAIARNFLAAVRSMSGLGNFSNVDLGKVLAGKNASVGVSVDSYDHGFVGSTTPKHLETMMQLLYLNFTAPRFDEKDFNTIKDKYAAALKNLNTNPDYVFQKRASDDLTNSPARRQIVSTELLDKMQFDRLQAINATLYPDADDFTFVFVGNVDPVVLKPLVEKYIGSIPSDKQAELGYKDDGVRQVPGQKVDDFRTPMQQPKVSILQRMLVPKPYTLRNHLTAQLLAEALSARYLESIREEKGGTYGVHVAAQTSDKPVEQTALVIQFDTNEAMADELMEIVRKEIETIAAEGPRAEDIEKTREYLLKEHANGLEKNGAWAQHLERYYAEGVDWVNTYPDTLKSITYDDIKGLAAELLSRNDIFTVIMRPEQQ